MARRFVYLPTETKPYHMIYYVDFKWEPGMSSSQRKLSRDNLHRQIKHSGVAAEILECSSISDNELGLSLSAFNLPYFAQPKISVESIYQGSKIYTDLKTNEEFNLTHLYWKDSLTAKKHMQTLDYSAIKLKEFKVDLESDGHILDFPTQPKTAFYDYIYIKSAVAKLTKEQLEELSSYQGFTDTQLRWYDGKVTACQAMSVAVLVGLIKVDKLDYSINYECGF